MGKEDQDIIWSIIHFNELSSIQLFDLMELRTQIFVVEQNCPYQEVDTKDKSAFHVLGYDRNGLLIAVARVLPLGISYDEVSFGRVAIRKEYRGKGTAHELTQKLISFIKTHLKSDEIRISAQSHLLQFYKSHGFKAVSKEYDEDGIPHLEMLL